MPNTSLDLNLIVAALWGKVLYVAQFGSCLASIIRGEKELNIAKETKGEIIVSSGIVERGDVLILGSSHFKELFSEGSLAKELSKLNDENFLLSNTKISAVIAKFDVLDIWGKDEVIKFVTPVKKVAKVKILWVLALILISILGVFLFLTLKRSASKEEAKSVPSSLVSELNKKVEQARGLLGSDDEKAKELLSEVSSSGDFNNLSDEEKENLKNVLGEATSILDKINKVERISKANVIYDTTADSVASVKGIAAREGTIIIWSGTDDNVIKITFTEDTVNSLKSSFGVNINSGDIYDNKLFALSDSGLYKTSVETITSSKEEVSGEVDYKNSKVLRMYYGNGYILGQNSITKLSSLVSGFSASSWLKSQVSLENAVDLAIDGNVYILFKDGVIKKFYVGEEQTDLTVKGLSENFKEPKYIFTNIDLNEIYVLDAKDKSIVVLDKTGAYQRKYIVDDKDLNFEDTKGFVLSDDGKEAYVLIGTKLVKFGL